MDKITSVEKLQKIANAIRADVISMLSKAGSGHLGSSLGLADVFAVLYFNLMNHKPESPDWEFRDRFVLSIGHVAPVLYATLAHAGYFQKAELMELRQLGSRLQGHPSREAGLPGLELASGSLGQGLSVAVGMAISAKSDKKKISVYSVHGDGELQEGSIWEAAMSAAFYKLDNLTAIVDRNLLQIDGNTEKVMALEPLKDKWIAFGWECATCNGNNIQEIILTMKKLKLTKDKPKVLIANTLMGKGVASIENDYLWHGKAPDMEQAKQFIQELKENYGIVL